MKFPDYRCERKCLERGYTFVIGCDEAGRGPLAGPVVAAACVLDPKTIGKRRSKNKWYARVRDSKTIPELEREILCAKILENTLAHGIGVVSEREIDKLNIHNASLLAMQRAVTELVKRLNLKSKKLFLFLDGRFEIPEVKLEQRAIIGGDAKVLSISAASILAKVHRDNMMRELDGRFPGYGFARHKGYGTREHQNALKKLGISLVHRRSFVKI